MNEQLRGGMGQRWVESTSVYPLEVLYEARVVSLPGTQEMVQPGQPCRAEGPAGNWMKWSLYLYSSFRQVDPGSQLGPDMDVGVVGEAEELLQFL